MQDKAIVEIGKLQKSNSKEPYQDFVQNMFPGKPYEIVDLIFEVTKEEGVVLTFGRVDLNLVSEKNFLQYAYRKGSPRGGDITFTTKLNNINKLIPTFKNQAKNIANFCKSEELFEDQALILALKEVLERSEERILDELKEKLGDSIGDAKKPLGITIVFEEEGKLKYLEQFQCIRKVLYKVGTSGKSEKYKVRSEGKNQLCSICNQTKPLLHGFASPFKFATVDKPGVVSGFFRQVNNWKNYPICSECALDFEKGQNFITQNLSKSFYGKRYLAIPKVIFGSDQAILEKAISLISRLEYQPGESEKIRSRENHLLKKIGEAEGGNNWFSLNLLFFEENPTTKAIKIKLFLEEMLPSRFQQLFVTIPRAINKNQLFKKALVKKKEPTDLKFHFGIVKAFFEEDFYEAIQKIFKGEPISEELLFRQFIFQIRANYNKAKTSDGYVEPVRWTVLKAIMLMAYLRALNIIPKNKKYESMEITDQTNEVNSSEEKKPTAFNGELFRKFIDENQDFFDPQSGYRIGVFSIGVLVRQVLFQQYKELDGNTPFEKKLKGYHLNPEILKTVYIEALNKLGKYTKLAYFNDLRDYINNYFILNSHKLDQISNSELSFYFVAGLEFGNNFRIKSNKDHE